jgi:hypothetical protein
MYVITATFDAELAYGRIREMLTLSDAPEALAERLGIARDVELVKQGVITTSFKRLLTDMKRHRQFLEIGQQIAEAREGKTMARFLGSGFQDKKVAKLEDERKKFDSPLESQRWFYSHPRVVLLSAIRDFALDGSLHPDAMWSETEPSKLPFPIVAMFEAADLDFAKTLTDELEKPLKQTSPEFLLQKFEGHRSIGFDLATNIATYYMPAPAEA